MTTGIYLIRHTSTGKVYVGSSCTVERRIQNHLAALRSRKHRNARLQAAWAKYGEAAFTASILLTCRRCDLEMYEQAAMDALGAYVAQGGFNLRPFAFVNKGRPGSELQKQVTRDRTKGTRNLALSAVLARPERAAKSRSKLDSMRRCEDIEAKRRASIRAAYASPEKRAAQAAFVVGIKRSPETVAKLRVAAAANAARRKASGYVQPRGPDGRMTAKTLSETSLSGGSALGALMGAPAGQ